MNHIHITLCTLFDYFGVLNVRNTVIKEIKNSDFFCPSNFLELVQYIIFPNSFVCGIKVENFNDIHEGDIIENYELKVEE